MISALEAYTEPGIVINSVASMAWFQQRLKKQSLNTRNQGFGKFRVQYRLRDWLAAVLGRPIPVIHCPSCGTVPKSLKFAGSVQMM